MYLITHVVDSSGMAVPSGSTTHDNKLVISGTGTVGGGAVIESNGVAIGLVTADTNGNWTITRMASPGRYSLIAVDFWGEQSPSWTITVADPPAPGITFIADATPTFIPEGGIAVGDTITLSGTGAANRRVEIFDGSTSMGTVVATNGSWTLQLTGLAPGNHSFTVVAEGGSPVSPPRTLTVMAIASGFQDFDAQAPGVLPVLTPITYPSGLVITLLTSQPVDPDAPVSFSHIPGRAKSLAGRLNITPHAVLDFNLNCAAKSVVYFREFGAMAGSRVKYFNPRGRELGSHSLPKDSGSSDEGFIAPPGEYISSMRIEVITWLPTVGVFSLNSIMWTSTDDEGRTP